MKYVLTVLTLILVAGLSRLIPHPWNFTAISAMALFSGSRMPQKAWAFLAPVLSLLWTDAILGFHETVFYVYAAVFLITIIGFFIKPKISQIALGSFISSIAFFVITNFGVWATQSLYPLTFDGFLKCYAMAIPFFQNQLLGDLFYSGVLFGALSFIKSCVPTLNSSSVA